MRNYKAEKNAANPFMVAVAFAALALTAGAASADMQVVVDSISAYAGDSVEVDVHLITNGEQPSAIVLMLVYDETKLVCDGVVLGQAASDAGKSLAELNPPGVGILGAVVYGERFVIGDGCLLTATFTVYNTVAAGEVLTIAGDGSESAADPDAVEIPVSVQDGAITVIERDTVATPKISPAVNSGQPSYNIEITCATEGATIRYTLDGTDPTQTSTQYAGTFPITGDSGTQKTVKAKAWKEGSTASAVASMMYTFKGECLVPAAPTNVQASDGTYTNRVVITWNAVADATEYQVYRDGTEIGDPRSQTSYSDFGADAPTIIEGRGCFAKDTITYNKHTYTVTASNVCGESEPSTGDTGWRGAPEMSLDVDFKVTDEALPAADITPLSELAVRLTATEPIDPVTVWARAEGDGWFDDAGFWRPTAPDDGRDGWVVFVPKAPWPANEVVTVTVGAFTESGVEVGAVSREFHIGSEDSAASYSSGPVIVEMSGDGDVPELTANVLSPPYRIGPDGVFDQPIPFWIPLPEGADVNALEIYYFSEAEEHRGWYLGENVIGWMVPDSRTVVEQDGQYFLEIQVNHSGIVQLADAQTVKVRADVSMFLGFAVLLGMRFVRRRQKK
ncbi:MAG: chitobiase/beta-hexosaminidase C-terminal domain-containing protein [Candidatus Hydrogenedentes bacterium]|nr:chitobiase/beta-hexosaminidase C-terminal domain-containing protein [Candidatus Hydrogenedentota bacterium]